MEDVEGALADHDGEPGALLLETSHGPGQQDVGPGEQGAHGDRAVLALAQPGEVLLGPADLGDHRAGVADERLAVDGGPHAARNTDEER